MQVSTEPQYYYNYSSLYVGTVAMDQTCLDYDSYNCVPDFIWFNAYYGSSSKFNGVLGLKPDQYYYGTPPLLINFLYN